jgi:outer membrane protein OmpA-like peptidoglycan-associated protein
MRHYITMFGGTLAIASAFSTTARAQERSDSYLAQHVRAPREALELKVGAGYTEGFGMIAPGRTFADVTGAGIGVSADIDYRLSHPWSLGVEGQYQEFSKEQNSSARGLAANLGVTHHFDPVLRGDPWLRLGTGYRLLWENNPSGAQGITVMRHGFELLAGKVGYDVRVSEDVAIAPVIGADLNVFVWEDPSNGSTSAMSKAQVGTFVYAGLQGRFDLGGTRDGVVAKAKRESERTGVTVPQPESPIAPVPVEQPQPTSIVVSEDILRACSMNLDAIGKAPKFDFDKSDVLPEQAGVLIEVADCFTTGPLKDARLQLVGRADPRGSAAYNNGLGTRRANQVAADLEELGVETSKIDRTSRGKLDARGREEATWAIDRRVDILLAH